MTTIETSATTIQLPDNDFVIDDAQLAAVAFLARYSGRTLDAYRHDLRGFFQWAADTKLVVLAATRSHIELHRSRMEERGPGGVDDRPALVDSVRVLPLRLEPSPVRSTASPTSTALPTMPSVRWATSRR